MSLPPPGWHADPTGRCDLRWWDGNRWSDHASRGGSVVVDPLDQPATSTAPATSPRTLSDSDIVVFRQRPKVIEVINQYDLLAADGATLAVAQQVGQSLARKAVRIIGSLDALMPVTLEVRDGSGALLFTLAKRGIGFAEVSVDGPDGQPVGRIDEVSVFGKPRFELRTPERSRIGELKALNWRAWEFQLLDADGTEVARITKQWRGVLEFVTTGDSYVLVFSRSVGDPLRTLVLASALAIDTALKQADLS